MIEPHEILVYERKRRAFLDAIQPILKMKMRIYSMTLPTILVSSNGEVERDYHFSSEQQRALANLDEMIDACGYSCYGGEWRQLKARPDGR